MIILRMLLTLGLGVVLLFTSGSISDLMINWLGKRKTLSVGTVCVFVVFFTFIGVLCYFLGVGAIGVAHQVGL